MRCSDRRSATSSGSGNNNKNQSNQIGRDPSRPFFVGVWKSGAAATCYRTEATYHLRREMAPTNLSDGSSRMVGSMNFETF